MQDRTREHIFGINYIKSMHEDNICVIHYGYDRTNLHENLCVRDMGLAKAIVGELLDDGYYAKIEKYKVLEGMP